MGDWPIYQGAGPACGKFSTEGACIPSSLVTSSSYGVPIPSGSGALSDWSALAGSSETPEVSGLVVQLHNLSAGGNAAVQIGIGAAGAETVLLDKLSIQGSRANQAARWYTFPVELPEGTRYSARLGASSTAISAQVGLSFLSRGLAPVPLGGRSKAYGLGDTGVAATLDPGASANVKGAWGFVTSSGLDFPTRHLTFSFGNRGNTAMTTTRWRVDIGYGASSDPKPIVADLLIDANTTGDDVVPNVFQLFCSLSSGTMVLARAQSTSVDAADRLLGIAMLGLI